MRESLGRSWEQERSNTSSPADSASTCSSSSKKRDKLPKTKNKNNKNHKGSPNLGVINVLDGHDVMKSRTNEAIVSLHAVTRRASPGSNGESSERFPHSLTPVLTVKDKKFPPAQVNGRHAAPARIPTCNSTPTAVRTSLFCERGIRKAIFKESVLVFAWRESGNQLWKNQDLNLDLPVIGSLVYCESGALDYAATKVVPEICGVGVDY
uniref:Uncharacterized protein n=1 Tax=Timema genevievae TaxID=629358 RepID=A0A7R9JT83_TIMGE|nr:unnamed protein product [Timema genevievae]